MQSFLENRHLIEHIKNKYGIPKEIRKKVSNLVNTPERSEIVIISDLLLLDILDKAIGSFENKFVLDEKELSYFYQKIESAPIENCREEDQTHLLLMAYCECWEYVKKFIRSQDQKTVDTQLRALIRYAGYTQNEKWLNYLKENFDDKRIVQDVKFGYSDILGEILLETIANPDVYPNSLELIIFLIKNGAHANYKGRDNIPPLYQLVYSCSVSRPHDIFRGKIPSAIAMLLLTYKANPGFGYDEISDNEEFKVTAKEFLLRFTCLSKECLMILNVLEEAEHYWCVSDEYDQKAIQYLELAIEEMNAQSTSDESENPAEETEEEVEEENFFENAEELNTQSSSSSDHEQDSYPIHGPIDEAEALSGEESEEEAEAGNLSENEGEEVVDEEGYGEDESEDEREEAQSNSFGMR